MEHASHTPFNQSSSPDEKACRSIDPTALRIRGREFVADIEKSRRDVAESWNSVSRQYT